MVPTIVLQIEQWISFGVTDSGLSPRFEPEKIFPSQVMFVAPRVTSMSPLDVLLTMILFAMMQFNGFSVFSFLEPNSPIPILVEQFTIVLKATRAFFTWAYPSNSEPGLPAPAQLPDAIRYHHSNSENNY